MLRFNQNGGVQLLILLLLLVGIGVGVFKPKASVLSTVTTTTSFSFSSVKSSYKVGEEIVVKILARSDITASNLFDAKVKFDPAVLQLGRVDTTSTFIKNWVEQYWGETGKISLVGGTPNPGFLSRIGDSGGIMATLYFKALKTGSTTLSFENTSAIYSNLDNTNILVQRNPITLSIISPTPSLSPTPKPAPTPTPAPQRISDNFNRSNNSSTLGSAWSILRGRFGISSNQAYVSGGCSAPAYAVVDGRTGNGTLDVTLAKNIQDARIIFRAKDLNNNYFLERNGWGYHIEKTVNGRRIELTRRTRNATFKDGDKIKITLSGSMITVFVNDKYLLTVNDSSIAGTKYGIGSWCDSRMRFDDFSFTP